MGVDTLSIARDLRAAELPVAQAEAIADAIGRSSSESLTSAASKADIAGLETKIEAIQSKLIMWLVSTQIAVGALTIAIIKF